VTLPFRRVGVSNPIAIVPAHVEAPTNCDIIRVPVPWRMIATMNVFDKELLYRLSYALMRRFAFIEVESPSDEVIANLLQGESELIRDLLVVRRHVDLGPAVFLDAGRYATRRITDPDVTRSRVLYEAFYAYLLPQLEAIGDDEARELFDDLAHLFDPPEFHTFRRVIRTVLGSRRPERRDDDRQRPDSALPSRPPERPAPPVSRNGSYASLSA
jgi:MoxR-like ATPase